MRAAAGQLIETTQRGHGRRLIGRPQRRVIARQDRDLAVHLVTCGGFGIWQLIDIIFILTGKYTDAQGRPLLKQ